MDDCGHETLKVTPSGGIHCPACDRLWRVPEITQMRAALTECHKEIFKLRDQLLSLAPAQSQ